MFGVRGRARLFAEFRCLSTCQAQNVRSLCTTLIVWKEKIRSAFSFRRFGVHPLKD